MSERRNAGIKINVGNRVFVALAVLLVWGGLAMAQESLQSLAEQEGHDWIAGRWIATTDDGQEIQLIYKWQLDGHLGTVSFTMGDYAYQGMIFYQPMEQKLVEVGVDNKGGTAKGSWDVEGDMLVSKSDRTDAQGKTQRMVITHSKGDKRTMTVAVYAVGPGGTRADEPLAKLEFKRKGGRNGEKADKVGKTGKMKEKPTGERQRKAK